MADDQEARVPYTLNNPDRSASITNKLYSTVEAVERLKPFLENTRMSLESKIDNVTDELTMLHADHQKLADKVHDAEQLSTKLQPITQDLDFSLQALEDCVHSLERRAKDAEEHLGGCPP
ncbi:hypothetical protein NDU88_005948 [Pleurodeles waltl]|uniref:Uncharacterized protein n=1 Tax=Pleurodeles waltl TaxID=8319 RepID=A0AAV7NPA6_PLEWA|nr:hypothetical protein NDU88_005948 [Pleurodeles waltl]